MKRSFAYLLIVLTVVNITALGTILLMRQRGGETAGCGASRESCFEQIKRDLELTPVQVERFERIRSEFHGRVDSLGLLMGEMRIRLLRHIWSGREEEMDSLLTRMSGLQLESQRLVINRLEQMREVLTPEQWERFYGIVAERCSPGERLPGQHGRPARKRERR